MVSLDLDKMLKELNPMGKYQIRMAIMVLLGSISAGIGVLAFAFTGFRPNYRCAIHTCETLESAQYFGENNTLPGFYLSGFPDIESAINNGSLCMRPKYTSSSNRPLETGLGTCDQYINKMREHNGNIEMEPCRHEDLVFDKSLVKTSVTVDYEFTCNEKVWYSIFNALYMVGMLLGSMVMGMISDKFGRRIALIISNVCLSVAGTLSAFAPNPWFFGIMRVITGMGGMGNTVGYVLMLESTTKEYGAQFVLAGAVAVIIGQLILVTEAYFIREWFWLQIAAHAPLALCLLLSYFLPESPRWLLTHDNVQETKKVIKKISRMNNKPEPNFEGLRKQSYSSVPETKGKASGLKELFQHKVIAKRSLLMFFQWFSVTFCYYGITFSITSLSGDPYLNMLIAVLTEIPGLLIGHFSLNTMGRRFVLGAMQAASGICCTIAGILVLYPDLTVLQIILVNLGKFGASSAIVTLYLYTCELFPTQIRSTALGCSSMVARIGSIVSLLLGATRDVWKPLPMVIMGLVGIIGGGLVFGFPETTGQALPMTMEEAINIEKNSKFRMCSRNNVKD